MTQFAIFYELPDLSSMSGSLNASSLPSTLRNRVLGYWNGGLKNWSSSPLGIKPGSQEVCPNCHMVVINNNKGSLADFIQLLRDVAAQFPSDPLAQYLIALADDLAVPGSDGAQEPWP